MSNRATLNNVVFPSDADSELSEVSSRSLAAFLTSDRAQKLKVIEENGEGEIVEIPAPAFRLLIDILSQMARGNAVRLIPVHAELTTQEAANLLNVSRPYLIKLLESQQIPFHKVGRHRRVRCEDIMQYKQDIDTKRSKVLDELVAQAQELNMGYD
ncbi:MAG: helix-turn-helix domain-containing protein [Cyanobacteria bacterium SBLK]|nr:helix-turn-helix domain-containing protein [Cyanobacteria bacterium SBLK]